MARICIMAPVSPMAILLVSLGHLGRSYELAMAEQNKAVIKEYFDGVFLSSDFKLDEWLENHVADDSVFQFCPLTAVNVPSNPYPHCTDAKGKKAFLAYVEKDQTEFGNTRVANITYAVSEDASQVFSRYMVSGTLEGVKVPWFDQIMAWNFDQGGKITKTVFWSDTLYWHKLYEKYSRTSQTANLMATGNLVGVAGSTLLQVVLMCLVFVSGLRLGQYCEARKQSNEMHYLEIS